MPNFVSPTWEIKNQMLQGRLHCNLLKSKLAPGDTNLDGKSKFKPPQPTFPFATHKLLLSQNIFLPAWKKTNKIVPLQLLFLMIYTYTSLICNTNENTEKLFGSIYRLAADTKCSAYHQQNHRFLAHL
jgi:hypothetical protein